MEIKHKSVYSFLLGLYLGDGWIWKVADKESYELRVSLDHKYPNIIIESIEAIEKLFNKPCRLQDREGCVNLKVTITEFMFMFPQYGIGHKHERDVSLVDFQMDIVSDYPCDFLKGLLYSDGSIGYSYTNPAYKDKLYKTYTFSNKSYDIFKMFIDTLSMIGIKKQMPAFYNDRLYKITIRDKASVAILEEKVASEKS
jgi:hypothetical protein